MHTPPNTGWIANIQLGSVSLLLHWSFPLMGVLLATWIAWLASFTDRSLSVPYFFYAATWIVPLVIVHELGHAAMAAISGLRVKAIALSGAGGWCACSLEPTPAKALLFYSGGFAAQISAFLATVALLHLYGPPLQPWLAAGVIVFTAGNAIILLGNAIPRDLNDGARIRDAWHAWRTSGA
jgi:hypothetical protein